MLASGMLQAGYQEGILSKTRFESYIQDVVSKLGTTMAIFSLNLRVDPFLTIRQMDSSKKNSVKSFLYETLQKVPNCEAAGYYFVSTLERSGL